MAELWALLHFIMPSLFDSHAEFGDWFSKDIEGNSDKQGVMNEHQLRRLHMILKPFMLRRIKKNVQNELGDKVNYCSASFEGPRADLNDVIDRNRPSLRFDTSTAQHVLQSAGEHVHPGASAARNEPFERRCCGQAAHELDHAISQSQQFCLCIARFTELSC